jgi:hypothetical protein
MNRNILGHIQYVPLSMSLTSCSVNCKAPDPHPRPHERPFGYFALRIVLPYRAMFSDQYKKEGIILYFIHARTRLYSPVYCKPYGTKQIGCSTLYSIKNHMRRLRSHVHGFTTLLQDLHFFGIQCSRYKDHSLRGTNTVGVDRWHTVKFCTVCS